MRSPILPLATLFYLNLIIQLITLEVFYHDVGELHSRKFLLFSYHSVYEYTSSHSKYLTSMSVNCFLTRSAM